MGKYTPIHMNSKTIKPFCCHCLAFQVIGKRMKFNAHTKEAQTTENTLSSK